MVQSGDGLPPVRLEAGDSLPGPLKVKTAADQLVDRLITAIALGVLLPGQKLPPEREFAVRLDVSRTTLRDAMHQLGLMGYVTIRRGRTGGVWINTTWGPDSAARIREMLLPRWQQLEWLFDLTKVVLPLISRLAAERRTPTDVAAIRVAVDAYERGGGDRDAMRVADHAIHSAIASATGNPYYVSLDNQLRTHLTFGTDSLPYTEEIRSRALADHRALADAIAAADADRAAELARHHFVDLAEKPMLALRERVLAAEVVGAAGAKSPPG